MRQGPQRSSVLETIAGCLLFGALTLGTASAQNPLPSAPAKGAQDGPAAKTAAPSATSPRAANKPKTSDRRLQFRTFDMVLAIVGEKIVALSEVQAEIDAQRLKYVETMRARNPNARMSANERRLFEYQWAWRFAQKKAARLQMLGNIRKMPVPEEVVQRAIEDNVQRKVAKDITDAGSSSALYQNLKDQGKTFEEYRAELRDQVTIQIIQSQTYSKYLQGGNLKVTPAEMWDYYKSHSRDFPQEAKARVDVFQLSTNKDPKSAMDKAHELRNRLMREGASRKLLREYRAFQNSRPVRPGESQRTDPDPVERFAFSPSTNVGAWSMPEVEGRFVSIFHLVSRQDQGLRGFKEVEVQRKIRSSILQARLVELERKLQRKQALSLSVWPPALLLSPTPRWPR